MNVYDWDDTIFKGDSTLGLVLYSYLHRPKTLISIPRTAACGLLYGLRIMEKQDFKENLFHMFTYVDDMEQLVDEYTDAKMDHVKEFYKKNRKEDDLVISASPEFLVSAFCKKLGIKHYMASPVNMHTGKYEGLNCHGKEKVRRFKERYPDEEIGEFYSDSISDTPLAELSRQPRIVKGSRLLEWKK